jgi:hypothetical protein
MSASILYILSTIISLQSATPDVKAPLHTPKQHTVSTSSVPVVPLKYRGGWDGN